MEIALFGGITFCIFRRRSGSRRILVHNQRLKRVLAGISYDQILFSSAPRYTSMWGLCTTDWFLPSKPIMHVYLGTGSSPTALIISSIIK